MAAQLYQKAVRQDGSLNRALAQIESIFGQDEVVRQLTQLDVYSQNELEAVCKDQEEEEEVEEEVEEETEREDAQDSETETHKGETEAEVTLPTDLQQLQWLLDLDPIEWPTPTGTPQDDSPGAPTTLAPTCLRHAKHQQRQQKERQAMLHQTEKEPKTPVCSPTARATPWPVDPWPQGVAANTTPHTSNKHNSTQAKTTEDQRARCKRKAQRRLHSCDPGPTKQAKTTGPPTADDAFGSTDFALKIRPPYLEQILTGAKAFEIRAHKCPHIGRISLIETGSQLLKGGVTITSSHRLSKADEVEHANVLAELRAHCQYKNPWLWELADPETLPEPIPVPEQVGRHIVTWLPRTRWAKHDADRKAAAAQAAAAAEAKKKKRNRKRTTKKQKETPRKEKKKKKTGKMTKEDKKNTNKAKGSPGSARTGNPESKKHRCANLSCRFNRHIAGARAAPYQHKGRRYTHCIFCSAESFSMATRRTTDNGNNHATTALRKLRRLDPSIFQAAVEQVVRLGGARMAKQLADKAAPKTATGWHSEWAKALRHRTCHQKIPGKALSDHEATEAAQDRKLARKFPALYGPNPRREEEWMSPRALALARWCRYKSWRLCSQCHRLLPQRFEATHARQSSQSGPLAPACATCKSDGKIGYWAPGPDDVPRPLRKLTEEAIEALRPFEIDIGPECRAPSGYRAHMRMARFKFKGTSVREQILALQSTTDQAAAAKAFAYLRANMDSSYHHFLKQHNKFLRLRRQDAQDGRPDPDQPIRALPCQFIETVGLGF